MNIRVNGRNVTVSAEENLLSGLLQNGFQVPNLCYLKELEPFGGCGLCLVEIDGMPKPTRACAVKPAEGMEVQTESPRILQSRKQTLELLLSDHRGDCRAPCVLACPANQDCQGYIGLIADGRFEDAFARIMADNPLPGCIGRVCPHPCEEACRRELMEGPLSIMRLKRFAADWIGAGTVPEVLPCTGKTVAVIGAGPSGLSAAYFLALKGHKVDVFDQMGAAGGMLRYGIPAYRLPDAVIDLEVSRIESMGVTFHLNQKLGADLQLSALRAQFDAVYLAVGAWGSVALGCANDHLPGVLGGIDFLKDVAVGHPPEIGNRVAVVGGGNTAMDVARTAIRLGAEEVHLLYRRTRAEMPADQLEIAEAEEEGVHFQFLTAPDAVLEQDGRACGLRLQIMKLGAPDASGRRRPEPTGECQEMRFDTIIAAIGQKVLPAGLEEIEKHRWQTIRANPETYETNLPGVFAGGDAINDGPGIAIAAIAHGKEAAQVIDGALHGKIVRIQKPSYVKQKEHPDLSAPEVPRAIPKVEPPAERVSNFNEFSHGLSRDEALKEAGRCLECGCCDLYDCRLLPLLQQYDALEAESGHMRNKTRDDSHPFIWRDENKCILCGLCVRVCSDLVGANALGFVRRGFETSAQPAFDQPLLTSECISCDHCADICPTGALQARVPFAKSPALPAKIEAMVCERCQRGCRFDLYRYGDHVIKAVPQAWDQCCSIGRYGAIIDSLPGREHADQATLRALTGDLAAYQGRFPVNIGPYIVEGPGRAE